MSLSNLYFRGCFEQLSDDQKSAVEEAGGESSVVDRSCSSEDVNTCGVSVEELFDTYQIYDPQKGLYKSWGDIEFPWKISGLTPGLLFAQSDDRWGVASYRSVIAYPQGSRVLVIEDYGHRVSLYESSEDIVSVSKAFDPSKWTKICHVRTTKQVGLPTPEELRARYKPYRLEVFDTRWGEYTEEWSAALLQQSLTYCASVTSTISELNKCVSNRSSDEWGEARIRRQFFYRDGDIVLVDGECDDALCVYIATQDIPVSDEFLSDNEVFDPNSDLWQLIYCVPTGRNKCLEYQRRRRPEAGYDVTEIGSLGHFVEVPVPYRLRPSAQTLDQSAEVRLPPRVLSQAEIDALTQPQEE